MKNKYNFSQIAQVYCQEIGVEIPFMEEYLITIFQKKPDNDKINEFEDKMKATVITNSEYFPEYWSDDVPFVEGELDLEFRQRRRHKRK